MMDILIFLIIAAILGGAAWYVYRAKKRGVRCVGCPDAGNCAAKGGCKCCSGCSCRQ